MLPACRPAFPTDPDVGEVRSHGRTRARKKSSKEKDRPVFSPSVTKFTDIFFELSENGRQGGDRDGQENGRIQGICDPDCDTRSLHGRTDPSPGQTYGGEGAPCHGCGGRLLFIRTSLNHSRIRHPATPSGCLRSGGGSPKYPPCAPGPIRHREAFLTKNLPPHL